MSFVRQAEKEIEEAQQKRFVAAIKSRLNEIERSKNQIKAYKTYIKSQKQLIEKHKEEIDRLDDGDESLLTGGTSLIDFSKTRSVSNPCSEILLQPAVRDYYQDYFRTFK